MLGLGGVPSLIMLCGLCFLPESPRWLITKGRMVAAKAVRPPSRCARLLAAHAPATRTRHRQPASPRVAGGAVHRL